MNRRQWLACSLAVLATSNHSATAGIDHLPRAVTFKGSDRYAAIMARAVRENWAALPIGPRISRIGRAFLGIPYMGYTLEIHDRIECPSVNCSGLDCWTFFEKKLTNSKKLKDKLKIRFRHLIYITEYKTKNHDVRINIALKY